MSNNTYAEVVQAIERMHRQSLDTVKIALESAGVRDLTSVQAMMLYNLGDEELSVGELGKRGAYVGSNISYNIARMVENGYIARRQSPYDRRSTVIHPTDKGREAVRLIGEEMAQQNRALHAQGVSDQELEAARATLKRIEGYWGQLRR